jgi:hypothetical protein
VILGADACDEFPLCIAITCQSMWDDRMVKENAVQWCDMQGPSGPLTTSPPVMTLPSCCRAILVYPSSYMVICGVRLDDRCTYTAMACRRAQFVILLLVAAQTSAAYACVIDENYPLLLRTLLSSCRPLVFPCGCVLQTRPKRDMGHARTWISWAAVPLAAESYDDQKKHFFSTLRGGFPVCYNITSS